MCLTSMEHGRLMTFMENSRNHSNVFNNHKVLHRNVHTQKKQVTKS